MNSGQTAASLAKPATAAKITFSKRERSGLSGETRSWLLVQGKAQSLKLLWSLWASDALTLQSGHGQYCECVDSDKAT